MNEPLITICIAAYNAAKFIDETLQSVKKQTYQNWELVVVEDGTADGTERIVNNFKSEISQNVIYFHQKKNLGISATRNTCFSFSKGKWIALLDSDDIWHQDHLADLMSTAIAHPGHNFINSEVLVFDSQTGKILPSEVRTQKAINQLPISLFEGTYSIQPSAIMLSAELYKLVGGFDPNLRYCEDREMWFRCARAGSKFALTGKASCYYRKHGRGLSSHSEQMSVAMAQIFSMHSNWEEIPKSIRMRNASNEWLSAARIVRKRDKSLAKEHFYKSIKYEKTFNHLGFWILIHLF